MCWTYTDVCVCLLTAVAADQNQLCSVTVVQSNIFELKPQLCMACPVKQRRFTRDGELLKQAQQEQQELMDPNMFFFSDSNHLFLHFSSIFYNGVSETIQWRKKSLFCIFPL